MVKNIIKIVALLMAVTCLGFLTKNYFLPEFRNLQKIKAEEQQIDKAIKAQEEEKNKLRKEKQNLENNSFFVEKAARNKLGYAKKGDLVYRFK